jgi:hypothetical protein
MKNVLLKVNINAEQERHAAKATRQPSPQDFFAFLLQMLNAAQMVKWHALMDLNAHLTPSQNVKNPKCQ